MSSMMEKRDRIIPWYFVMFFVAIAIVDGLMVTLAVRTHTGLVTDHPYEKGLAYNDVVKASELQSSLGWAGEIIFETERKDASPAGILQFQLYDKSGNRITPDILRATITRPTQAGMDFTVDLKSNQQRITFPARGLWEIRMDATLGASHYQQSKRIIIE